MTVKIEREQRLATEDEKEEKAVVRRPANARRAFLVTYSTKGAD